MNDQEIIAKYKKYEPFFGNWYIKSFVGEGGFAKVFEIVRNDFGSEYTSALKVITVSKTKTEIQSMRSEGMSDAEIRESMYRIVEDTVKEIQLMYKLKGNGNIVGYEDHAVVEHEDGAGWDIFIKMEFLTSIGAYIKEQKGMLSKRNIIKLGIDICKALEACQLYNIIHRDIKADNIFISKGGEFKLGDFGIARVIEKNDMELSKKGTSTYMAPEVYKGQTYTSMVDIYSLGMVLYRLLNNNRVPFLPPYPQPISLDDRDKALMLRMSGEKLPKPAQAESGRLTEIVLKACAFRPEERYSSPMLMRQELEAILQDEKEVTNDEPIMIYEEDRVNSEFSFGNSSFGNNEEEMTGATEILKDEDDAVQKGATVNRAADIKILCKNCGNTISRDAAFCPICGQSQREEGAVKKKSKEKKVLPVVGISVAVLALVLIIGVVIGTIIHYSSQNNAAENEVVKADTDNEIEDIKEIEEETVEPGKKDEKPEKVEEEEPVDRHELSENILMVEPHEALNEDIPVLGSDVARKDILSITFLDALDTMPPNAWDVSADRNGYVMAWVEPVSGGYNLYIGGEGGVMANEDASYLFANYSNLNEINFNHSFHTEQVTNMAAMFYECSGLTRLNLTNFDTSNVTDMFQMFWGCDNLTLLDLRNFDTSKVETMQGMFSGCSGLTSLEVSSFDTSNVSNMGGMFSHCSGLTSLDVSNFNTSKVTQMKGMFFSCTGLTSLDLSSFDTSRVESTANMLYECDNLTNIDLSNFSAKQISQMREGY